MGWAAFPGLGEVCWGGLSSCDQILPQQGEWTGATEVLGGGGVGAGSEQESSALAFIPAWPVLTPWVWFPSLGSDPGAPQSSRTLGDGGGWPSCRKPAWM